MTLSTDHLTVRFGRRTALDAVSCAFTPGKVTVVLGPNAAGKSTLLRCLIGAQRPSDGSAQLDGRAVHELPPRALAQRMSYVSQRPAMIAGFTVREVVHFGCYALERQPDRVDAALRRLELADQAERPMHELSVGQQQRVSLARALAQFGPRGCLILDEPTSAMDLRHARSVHRLLQSLANDGATVIVAMHDLVAACSIADEALLLDAGRLVAHGAAAEVLRPDRLEAIFGVPFVESTIDGVTRTIVPDGSARHGSR